MGNPTKIRLKFSLYGCLLFALVTYRAEAKTYSRPHPTRGFSEVEARLMKDGIPYSKETLQVGEDKFLSLVLTPSPSGAVLSREAFRVQQEYDGLKFAFSEELLNTLDVGGLFDDGARTIFVGDNTFLKDEIEDSIYKHELLHARSSAILNAGAPSEFLAESSPVSAKKVCSVSRLVKENSYITEGYWFEEAPAFLVGMKFNLKGAAVHHFTKEWMGYVKGDFDYLRDLTRCAREIVTKSRRALPDSSARDLKDSQDFTEPTPYVDASLKYRVGKYKEARVRYLIPKRFASDSKSGKRELANRLRKLNASLGALEKLIATFRLPSQVPAAERHARTKKAVARIDSVLREIFPAYLEK